MRTGPRPVPGPPGDHLPRGGLLGALETYHDVVQLTVVLLLVAVLVGWGTARRRELAGTSTALARRLSFSEVGVVALTLPAVWITMLPGADAGQAPARVSLVPLRDLATMSGVQVGGNLVLLAGLGLLAPVRFASLASLPRVLALAAAASTLIETAQYVLPLDRVASVDDVLLNTAGAGLAALVSRPWWCVPRVVPGS